MRRFSLCRRVDRRCGQLRIGGQCISYVTGSTHLWHSGGPIAPANGAEPISIEKAIEIARQQIPEATFDGIALPRTARQSYSVLMRVPEEVSVRYSSVTVDQYSGKPLQVSTSRRMISLSDHSAEPRAAHRRRFRRAEPDRRIISSLMAAIMG